jgi:hypothetical protein
VRSWFFYVTLTTSSLIRRYSGLLHPVIHLGLGVEFKQPLVIAEALAQTAVHDNWIAKYLLPAETSAQEHKNEPSKSIVQLLDEISADRDVQDSVQWTDPDKMRTLMTKASDRMIHYAAQYRVAPTEIALRTAEMTNAVAYFTVGAQRPPHRIMFDFCKPDSSQCMLFPSQLTQA